MRKIKRRTYCCMVLMGASLLSLGLLFAYKMVQEANYKKNLTKYQDVSRCLPKFVEDVCVELEDRILQMDEYMEGVGLTLDDKEGWGADAVSLKLALQSRVEDWRATFGKKDLCFGFDQYIGRDELPGEGVKTSLVEEIGVVEGILKLLKASGVERVDGFERSEGKHDKLVYNVSFPGEVQSFQSFLHSLGRKKTGLFLKGVEVHSKKEHGGTLTFRVELEYLNWKGARDA